MSDKSAIEWTDATWNPVTGCSKVSPGCAYCYAERLSRRYGWSKAVWTPANAEANVVLHPERLRQPLSWRQPRIVFVNSMSDLFHEQVPDDFIARTYDVMRQAPQHTFQVLTKRPERALEWYRRQTDLPGDLPNVWLGVSVENNRWVARADLLRAVPARTRFISAEPLLGPLDRLDLTTIDWLIVGGESGGPAERRLIDGDGLPRPASLAWVRDLRDRATSAGVAFFFKQWGGRTPKAGGRMLDGRTWDEMPMAHLFSEPQDGREPEGTALGTRGSLDEQPSAPLSWREGTAPEMGL
jgi:protein gp37